MKFQFKNTFLFLLLIGFSCRSLQNDKKPTISDTNTENVEIKKTYQSIKDDLDVAIKTGIQNTNAYLPFLKNKNVGIVTNATGIHRTDHVMVGHLPNDYKISYTDSTNVDFLLNRKINIKTIFAPEHGFRGTADAGEVIKDGKDTKTGLPIISLYGNNKKPKPEQLEGLDVVIFDIQDVGARFYTYISTLHYVMEACAENNIELIIFDRPNPNGNIVDGPMLEKEFTSFVGMHPIPVLHGLTIGEYAKMINGEKWLKNDTQCNIKVIENKNYNRDFEYSLPVKPSPNLPNNQAINLYASLCLFEGTNVSVGRGTEKQFQIYGSPFLNKTKFSFTPIPNFGAKEPMHKNMLCYGEDLTTINKVTQLELKWLIEAYKNTTDKKVFFNDFFSKLAGTQKLREQIEAGVTEKEIRNTWKKGLENFKTIRNKYLIY